VTPCNLVDSFSFLCETSLTIYHTTRRHAAENSAFKMENLSGPNEPDTLHCDHAGYAILQYSVSEAVVASTFRTENLTLNTHILLMSVAQDYSVEL
jgi:hypothetical protein